MQRTSQRRQLDWIRRRIAVIVESVEYSPAEKRIRVASQLERLLETVMESLLQEQQPIVQEALKLSEQVWS